MQIKLALVSNSCNAVTAATQTCLPAYLPALAANLPLWHRQPHSAATRLSLSLPPSLAISRTTHRRAPWRANLTICLTVCRSGTTTPWPPGRPFRSTRPTLAGTSCRGRAGTGKTASTWCATRTKASSRTTSTRHVHVSVARRAAQHAHPPAHTHCAGQHAREGGGGHAHALT